MRKVGLLAVLLALGACAPPICPPAGTPSYGYADRLDSLMAMAPDTLSRDQRDHLYFVLTDTLLSCRRRHDLVLDARLVEDSLIRVRTARRDSALLAKRIGLR